MNDEFRQRRRDALEFGVIDNLARSAELSEAATSEAVEALVQEGLISVKRSKRAA